MRDPRISKLGVSGYNKPKKTPNHPTKSHVVLAKVGDEIKTVRFGQQGVKGAGCESQPLPKIKLGRSHTMR
jgi:hypothetical protein